ncbi:MAG TPA: ribonuclease R [Bacilli bacterium]|nr:ribonuclease R [Bacilli bacterium]
MIKIKEGDVFEGQIEFYTNGSASLKVEENDIFIYKKNTANSLHLDKVKIQIFQAERKLEGRVIEVVSRFKTEFVGRVQISKNNTTFVIPDNSKMSVDFYIKGGLIAEDGQKVIVELTKWEDSKSPQGKIIKILGNSGDNNTEMNSIMFDYGLPIEFPQEVINESALVPEIITEKEISKRRDMRSITTITIDPVDAKDFDDALSINFVVDGKIEVGVHIADVSHYVKPGTKLDEEAFKRATSVYLVDRCVPMLPERLSNGICSLKPHEDRLAFSVIFTLDEEGNILDTWQGKTIIHSDHRFTYEQAQSVIESVGKPNNEVGRILSEDAGLGNMDFRRAGSLGASIIRLNNLAQKIRERRIKNGSIEMGGIEVRFKLAEDNKKPIGVYFKEQKEANKLIEEFMLLANKSVAKTLSDASRTNVYRVHDTPNEDKLNSLVSICRTFGYEVKIDGQASDIKRSLNLLLKEIKGKPEENMIETLVTRCMSKATYTIKNIGHYGLGFTHYSHFTSPIRRYPDLITHRLLFDFLNKKSQGNPGIIEEQSKWCSARELVAAKAQRDSIKYKQAEYLLDKIGNEFEGIVSGVTDWGFYVELIDSKCEGMIRYQSLEGNWSVDTSAYTIQDDNGKTIRLGDRMMVIVKSVDLEKKQIDFILKID